MVTAELALGILTALLIGLAASWAVALGVQQVVTADAAAQVARQLARGDAAAAAELAGRVPGLAVSASDEGPLVVVEARLMGRPLGGFPAVTTRAGAVAAKEPTP